MAPSAPEPSPGATVGPFRLRERIGTGGMGEVWRAEDPRPGADPAEVAVKLVAADRLADPDARARFEREVAAASAVDAPEVAAVVDADVTGPQPWLASVHVPGVSLAARVGDGGPLHDEALRVLGIGLARGLDAIHRAGVVHRDLTPGNVVLGPDGPVVVDFGVSRIDDATTITRAGALVGTPAWMAPEQLRHDEVSDASDVWAWGAVMAFAATGTAPVDGERTETVIARVLDGDLTLDGLPDWLDPVVRSAMDPEPARRPTADELLARLDRSGRGLAASAVTQVESDTRVAPVSSRPTIASTGAGDVEPPASGGRDWRRLGIRAGVLAAAVVAGTLLPVLLAVVVFTVGVMGAAGLRVWTEEQRRDDPPVVNAATVLVASVLLVATALSSVLGVALALVAVVAGLALFLAVGGDIG